MSPSFPSPTRPSKRVGNFIHTNLFSPRSAASRTGRRFSFSYAKKLKKSATSSEPAFFFSLIGPHECTWAPFSFRPKRIEGESERNRLFPFSSIFVAAPPQGVLFFFSSPPPVIALGMSATISAPDRLLLPFFPFLSAPSKRGSAGVVFGFFFFCRGMRREAPASVPSFLLLRAAAAKVGLPSLPFFFSPFGGSRSREPPSAAFLPRSTPAGDDLDTIFPFPGQLGERQPSRESKSPPFPPSFMKPLCLVLVVAAISLFPLFFPSTKVSEVRMDVRGFLHAPCWGVIPLGPSFPLPLPDCKVQIVAQGRHQRVTPFLLFFFLFFFPTWSPQVTSRSSKVGTPELLFPLLSVGGGLRAHFFLLNIVRNDKR